MVVLITLVAMSSTGVQGPQQEYDAYVAQHFANKSAICGAMMGGGGMGSERNVSLFRCAPGGKLRIFGASSERHSDGKTVFDYYPVDHTYRESKSEDEAAQFARMFGHRFAAPGQPRELVIEVRDGEFEKQPVRIFTFQLSGVEATEDLIVRKRDGRPLALRQYGDQAQHVVELVQLETNQTLASASWKWIPPIGARKRD